jgi:hypothetical protein
MIRVLILILLTAGCVKTPQLLGPEALLSAGQARQIPFAMRGKFSAKLTARGEAMPSLPGAMIVHRPDRFRIVLNAPIGGPVLTLVSNGTGAAMHLHRNKMTILEPDAQVALADLMGEGTGLASLTNVFLAGLPLPQAVPIRTETDEFGTQFVYAGPVGSELKVRLHPGGELAKMESWGSSGELLFSIAHESLVQIAGKGMPKVTVVEIPSQEVQLRLKFSDWSELAKIPKAFGLDVPPGMEVMDVKAALEFMGIKEDPEEDPDPEVEESGLP